MKKPFHVHDSMMLRVFHHSKFTPCRDSTWATSQYHCQGRCGLSTLSSCCLGDKLWRAVVGGLQLYSEGQGAKSCVVKCTRVPNQLSPHLPMDDVSTASSSTSQCRRYNPAEKGLENLNHLLIQVCTRVHMLCTFVMFLCALCTLCTLCTLFTLCTLCAH